jgi:hypothetical protein
VTNVLKNNKGNKTSAMPLGLAKSPVKYENILYLTGLWDFNN